MVWSPLFNAVLLGELADMKVSMRDFCAEPVALVSPQWTDRISLILFPNVTYVMGQKEPTSENMTVGG